MSPRVRAGFTLWEITVVFAVMAVTALLVVPQWLQLGSTAPRGASEQLLTLLRDTRRLAIMSNQLVTLRVIPESGAFRVDTSGVGGSGVFTSGRLELSAIESLETDEARLQFLFRPTGAAVADSLIVRGPDGAVLIAIDPWSGEATAYAR